MLAAAAAALALTGCAAPPADDRRAVTAVEPGECFSTDAEHRTAFVVDCAEPHLYEAVRAIELEPGPWPGDTAIQERVDAECPAALADYTGREPATDPDYVSQAFGPAEASWTSENDHRLVCLAASASGAPITGRAKDRPVP